MVLPGTVLPYAGAPANTCTGTAMGTGSVISGSSTLTITSGTIPTSGSNAIVITGLSGGKYLSQQYTYMGTGSSITMSVLWPGDTGAVTWMTTLIPGDVTAGASWTGAMTSYGTATSDEADLKFNYACMYNSPTSLTLSGPWQGSTGSGFYGKLSNLSGYGQQPFMLGIRTRYMDLIARYGPSPYASAYAALRNTATQWIHDAGVDAATLTTNYGRGFSFCEPTTIATSTAFSVRSPGCNYGIGADGKMIGREQNQELGNAIASFYAANPTPANRIWGDQMYGAVWGNQTYNTGSAYWDASSDAMNLGSTNLTDASIGNGQPSDGYSSGGKWYGFFAGMGALHRWPAEALGGVAPADNRTVYVPFTLAGVTYATGVQMTVTQPSGAIQTQSCSSSPCAVTVDARSGSVLVKMDYLNSTGTLLASSDTIPLYVPQ